ncbi:hypothetical protein IE81DRAFT_320655 [Ceraceosorus guamensis]|uniref:Phosphoesterase-domain-containing protein n=1 Tax=Ceraceosorus guamensis TaxID=1522189 RepID=A0A316W5E8_9BASI|nr:hypothetical protein IE81DRAFT_320655 [Ceraceosorus guamensis]PWN45059.1 hypothetical protein IE81DRAFT_320655 [Ceraceosorus guamensis]
MSHIKAALLPTLALILAAIVLSAASSAVAQPASLLRRAKKQSFVPPSTSPEEQSDAYQGRNNGTLARQPIVPGKAFDRIIHVWLENTDYSAAASLATFQRLQKQGQTLTSFHGVTHPSEPNYMASAFGSFFGLHDDNFSWIPKNITSVYDLLDKKGISYACYQENMPFQGFQDYDNKQKNYVDPSAPDYTFYVRKHNPCAFSSTFAKPGTERYKRNRNMNDFAADLKADALPQHIFVTPNMDDDGHDSGISYAAQWVDWFLSDLLKNPHFNSERTLVVLTFDENETYAAENRILTLLLGNAVPQNLRGSSSDLYMTHYGILATTQANWGLMHLGRGDVDPILSNIVPFVAEAAGYKGNAQVPLEKRPLLNLTGVTAGPLTETQYQPFFAPTKQAQAANGAGGAGVLLLPGLDPNATPDKGPAPKNLKLTGGSSFYRSQANVAKD